MSRTRQPSRPGAPEARAPSAGQARATAIHHDSTPATSPAALLTPDQAAEKLGVTARVMERWRGSGDGPQFVRLTRKTVRYRVEDLEAFVGARLRASTAPGARQAHAA